MTPATSSGLSEADLSALTLSRVTLGAYAVLVRGRVAGRAFSVGSQSTWLCLDDATQCADVFPDLRRAAGWLGAALDDDEIPVRTALVDVRAVACTPPGDAYPMVWGYVVDFGAAGSPCHLALSSCGGLNAYRKAEDALTELATEALWRSGRIRGDIPRIGNDDEAFLRERIGSILCDA